MYRLNTLSGKQRQIQSGLCALIMMLSLQASAVTSESPNEPAQRQNEKPVAESPAAVIKLDETVISGNQELPKVLYILPWREPQGLPDIEIQAEFTEAEVFRRLYPPAYRRELQYFETLDGIKDSTGHNQED